MNIVTGYRGEAHITSQQDQAKNQGIFGSGSYILDVGQKLRAEAVSANEVRIYDGVLSHQGVVAVVEKNTYDSVTIASGSQGADRCDLIVARYTKEGSTGVESMTFEVIMGTEGETTPPAYNTGDIQAGDSPVDMPIYEVHLSGIQIESLVPVASQIADIGTVGGKALMMRGPLPSGSINDVTEIGIYGIQGSVSYTNLPSGVTFGELLVFRDGANSGFISQLLTNASKTYIRNYDNSSWKPWRELFSPVEQVQAEYTSNAYVTEANFNRNYFYIKNEWAVLFIDIEITANMPTGTTGIEVGKVTLPKNLVKGFMFNIPAQNGTYGTLLVSITNAGVISIGNTSGSTAYSRYRQVITVPLA